MNSMYNPDTFAEHASVDFTKSLNRVYNFTYGWMSVGLAISGAIAWMIANHYLTQKTTLPTGLFTICTIAELLLVFTLSAAIHKLPIIAATLLFALYSVLNGVTLSLIFLIYDLGTIQSVFFITAGTFAGVAIFGSLTSANLSGAGRIAIMALWGIILASIVNIFVGSTGLHSLLSYVGVGIFIVLTAWDAQKVRLLAEQQHTLDQPTVQRLGILCALELYLDFINLFLFLLRILGGKGRD